MQPGAMLAKTVLISSLLTFGIMVGVLYIFRLPISEYLLAVTPLDQKTVPVEEIEPVVEAVERVNPAVVSVVVTKDVPIYEQYYETFNPWGFFGGFSIPRIRENGTEEREVGGGTGFIITDDGLIITNHHVVADAEARYSVLLYDGSVYEVDVLASDPDIDIAVLQITSDVTDPLTTVSFGDVSELRAGQRVIAIGNALAEFQNSVSVGVISGLSRTIVASDAAGTTEELHQVIQTDAAINPGNSGGPLLDIRGEVIGVNVATSRGADNIGFAIPADMVESVVASVQEFGEIIRPYLGVRYTTINSRFAAVHNLPVDYGALVISGENGEAAVLPDSPAAEIGLIENDIIIAVNGVSLESVDLARVLRQQAVDVPISIEILRDGEYQVLEVVLRSS